MANIELSSYVTGLSDAGTLDGTEELYLSSDEKTTTGAIAELSSGKIWKAYITQTGTSAPSLTVLVNTLGVTITPSYSVAGGYSLSGFDSNLTGLVSIEMVFNPIDSTKTAYAIAGSSSVIGLSTYLAGVQSDNVLGTINYVNVLTVTKYD